MALGRYSPRGPWSRALAVLAVASLLTPARAEDPEADPDAIAWREDYAAALEEARAGGRPLWIQFTGPWCSNCLRMERDSFTAPAVRERARRGLVPLKLRSDVNEDLALSLGLSGLPASVILDPSRRVLAARQGYLGPEELTGFLDEAVAAQAAERTADQSTDDVRPVKPPKPMDESVVVALSGYCPVSLVLENRMAMGRDDLSFEYESYVYKCVDQAALDAFRRDPERFLPANDGACPVRRLDQGEMIAGAPRWGVLYQERLYLCASEAEQLQFIEDPGRYAAVDVEDAGYCPHCIAQSGALVPGDPRWVLNRDGRRYWFPDPDHRRAFLEASSTLPLRR